MEGKLASSFNWKKYFADYKDDEAVQWDDFFEILSMWAISQDQTTLNYEDFAKAEENAFKQSQLDAFKKMTGTQ